VHRASVLALGGALIVWLLLAHASAAPSREQSAQIASLKTAIDQAARLFKQQKFRESAEQLARCQEFLAKAARGGDAEMITALQPAHDRLTKAHRLFVAQGIPLPPLPSLQAMSAAESEQAVTAVAPRSPAAASEPVSFSRQVAPILVARCGGCHVRRNMGEFSMANFAALMQGGENGAVITAGEPEASILIELVQAGEMPPPRPRPRPVPKPDLQVLRDWIAQGAKFDGSNEDGSLLEMVPEEVARASAGPGGPGGFGGGPGGRRPGAGNNTRPRRNGR
jgi:hypothetical protein